MKHYLDLVSLSAKARRRQSRMSVFCIVLAVFLVTAIFGMADMFVRSQIMKTQMESGNWHIAIRDIPDEEARLIAARPDVTVCVPYDALNYYGNQGYQLNGTETVLCGSQEEWLTSIFPDNITEGTFPRSEKEAMVTEYTRDQLKLSLGDEVTLTLPDGTEALYMISGFLKNTATLLTKNFFGMFVTTQEIRALSPDSVNAGPIPGSTAFYVKFESTGHIQEKIRQLKSQLGLGDNQVFENTMLLGLLGQSRNGFMTQIYIAAAGLSVLVLLSGILMIASSLGSNVAQRTEFFGLMRCIGATPRQVMRLVRKEALSWCAYAIPFGVFSGVAVTWILCAILRYLSPEYFSAMPFFSVSLPSILAGVVIGLLTVLLAAQAPAKRAARVSPLTAVSGNAVDFRPVRRAANTKWLRVETSLGIHHALSSRKNFLLVTGSFAFSVILFLSFSVTVTFMNHALTPLYPWAPDLSVADPDNICSIDTDLLPQLLNNPAVDAAYGRMLAYDVPASVNGQDTSVTLVSYDPRQFGWAGDYLQSGSLMDTRDSSGGVLAVFDPQSDLQAGATVKIGITFQTMTVTGLLSACPVKGTDVFICSEETFRQLTGEDGYAVIDIQLSSHADEDDIRAIQAHFDSELRFTDKRMEKSSIMGGYYCVWLFIYGFLLLIALITIFNIINSIALSVAARTKQYGAFRAIGLSNRQLSRMVVAEAATYGIAGCLVGTAAGLYCNQLLFNLMIRSRWGIAWTIPFSKLGTILLIVFLSVILAVYAPVKRLHTMSIVDSISAE